MQTKSPLILLFQRGNFSEQGISPSLNKSGKGRFSEQLLARVLTNKSPLIPIFPTGKCSEKNLFPSLEKHALSRIEVRDQGRFLTKTVRGVGYDCRRGSLRRRVEPDGAAESASAHRWADIHRAHRCRSKAGEGWQNYRDPGTQRQRTSSGNFSIAGRD